MRAAPSLLWRLLDWINGGQHDEHRPGGRVGSSAPERHAAEGDDEREDRRNLTDRERELALCTLMSNWM